jgi:hypothetical protein
MEYFATSCIISTWKMNIFGIFHDVAWNIFKDPFLLAWTYSFAHVNLFTRVCSRAHRLVSLLLPHVELILKLNLSIIFLFLFTNTCCNYYQNLCGIANSWLCHVFYGFGFKGSCCPEHFTCIFVTTYNYVGCTCCAITSSGIYSKILPPLISTWPMITTSFNLIFFPLRISYYFSN